MKRVIILSALLVLPAVSTAAVYQCTGKSGQTVFSGQPCGDDAVKLDHKAAPALGGSMITEGSREFLKERKIDSSVNRIDKRIYQLELRKKLARKQLDADMDRWRSNQARANNNLAGATWENSLAHEAEVKQIRYDSEVGQLNVEIDRLRSDRRRLLEQ